MGLLIMSHHPPQVLYEFLPLWVFLTIVLVPIACIFLYHQYKAQADEIRRRYRTSISEEFMQQLDNEASKNQAAAKKKASSSSSSSNGKANKGASKPAAPVTAPPITKKEQKAAKQAAAAAAALDDEDDDEMLLRLAQSQNRGKKIR